MVRILFAIALLFSVPAYALTDAQQSRLTLLEQQYTYLEQQKAKAVHAHDMWLNREEVERRYPGLPHTATMVFAGREDWSEALRTVWHISDRVYPDDAGPALATSPPEGLSQDAKLAHRKAAIPEIEALEKRMADEIATLKAGK